MEDENPHELQIQLISQSDAFTSGAHLVKPKQGTVSYNSDALRSPQAELNPEKWLEAAESRHRKPGNAIGWQQRHWPGRTIE